MPLVVVPENLHNPPPGIRFLRISGQMRMRIAKGRSSGTLLASFVVARKSMKDKKESQSDRPTTRLGVTADWSH
jgi:hypothetical protein